MYAPAVLFGHLCFSLKKREKRPTLGGGKVNHVAVRLEHVDLLNGLDGLGVELLERLLELLVIGVGPGGRALDRSSGGSLSTARRKALVFEILCRRGIEFVNRICKIHKRDVVGNGDIP